MVGAARKVAILGNLKDEVFEGYKKCPAVGHSTI